MLLRFCNKLDKLGRITALIPSLFILLFINNSYAEAILEEKSFAKQYNYRTNFSSEAPRRINHSNTRITATSNDEKVIDGDNVVEEGNTWYQSEVSDPFEHVNRVVFAINGGIDKVILRPTAAIYRAVTPKIVRKGVSNFLGHVATPITLANDILQGDMQRAETTIVRFMLNTVAGYGGLYDVASEVGYEYHYEDFGQTLAKYGVPSGPYIVLPILGPSTPRHVVGRAVDTFANPWTWALADQNIAVQLSPKAAEIISLREQNMENIDNVLQNSPDSYEAVKSIYFQNRKKEIDNGKVNVDDLPDIGDIPEIEE